VIPPLNRIAEFQEMLVWRDKPKVGRSSYIGVLLKVPVGIEQAERVVSGHGGSFEGAGTDRQPGSGLLQCGCLCVRKCAVSTRRNREPSAYSPREPGRLLIGMKKNKNWACSHLAGPITTEAR